MGPQCFLCWGLALLLLSKPRGLQCLSVRILNVEPVHEIPGSSLVLRARVEQVPPEEISTVTWQRETEGGVAPGRATLATCAGGDLVCASSAPNARANLEQREATLQIDSYGSEDGGVYAVTVTDRGGAQSTARCLVRTYEAVHHVSVSVNMSHSTLVCGEAWGTDPHFSWLHERVAVTQTVGRVSEDGAVLYVTRTPFCGHFTCMVSNKLGYSSATYAAAPCETEGRGTTAAVVCLVLLLLLFGGALAFLLWRRHGQRNSGERLHDHLDDAI